ncbi:ABC transporter permease [Nocardioides litoris]|uniref:ABC transporter permease n=1 Tax=Nocardioides litoris TaxID=1926648 RepID=UPI001120C1BB|nr:ABC transporter permease [Nocardioides litoris]
MRPDLVAAFVRRDWTVARSYRLSFAMETFGALVLLFVVFQVGKLVDQVPQPASDDLDRGFFPFVVVGSAVLAITQAGLSSFTTKMREEQTTGTLEVVLATPNSPSVMILASGVYQQLQSLVQASLLVLVAMLVGLRISGSPAAALATVAGLAGLVLVFASLGVLVAAFTIVFKRGNALGGLITAMLGLLGGVYFPVELLPGPLRLLAGALPFTWGVDALRASLLFGRVEWANLVGVLTAAAVLLPLSLWLFRAAVDAARRDGSLGHY